LKRTKDGKETVFDLPVNPARTYLPNLEYDDLIRMFEDREGRLWLFLQFGGYSYKLEIDRIEKIDTGIIRDAHVLGISQGRQWRYLVRHEDKAALPVEPGNIFFCSYQTMAYPAIITKYAARSRRHIWVTTHDGA